ncbi:MAG: phage Gp37/Gp68 family protein [Armatimonadota bacterium]|nr:phage Gp37/Gp68 family protein [Armatimonadota bacterium]
MARSQIEWTDSTWNPVTGCTKISPGCDHCYAERMARRLKAMGQEKYADGFAVRTHEECLAEPLEWTKPRVIFVNSMSDLFHKHVPLDFIQDVFATMHQADQHIFQVLTKRSGRMAQLAPSIDWPENVWAGVSVENQDYAFRLDHLRKVRARIRFVSFEPLIGPIRDVDLTGIDWVIVGGESGPGARPMAEQWVLDLKTLADEANAPFFFKQWGGTNKKRTGRELLGRTWDKMPEKASGQPALSA